MIEKIVGFLNGILRLNRTTEYLVIDLIAAIAPWLAPVLPAFLTGSNLFKLLEFPWYIALVSALVVELVGLSSMSTVLMLWTWNETKRESDPYAPMWLALVAGVIYMGVVLSVNTLLDIDPKRYSVLVKGLLSCMTVVAAIIIAVRGQHARRMEAKEREKQERKAERAERRAQETAATEATAEKEKEENGGVDDYRSLPLVDKKLLVNMPTAEIMRLYSVSDRTARNWRSNANRDFPASTGSVIPGSQIYNEKEN